jgi:hypothetical protein
MYPGFLIARGSDSILCVSDMDRGDQLTDRQKDCQIVRRAIPASPMGLVGPTTPPSNQTQSGIFDAIHLHPDGWNGYAGQEIPGPAPDDDC